MKLVRLLVILPCLMVWSCRSSSEEDTTKTDAHQGDILMGRMLRERTGMVSVFPPREDIRVGDLHVYAENPEAGSRPAPLDSVPRYGTIAGVTAAVQKQYNDRPDFPVTPDEYLPENSGKPAERTWAEASFKEGVFLDEETSDRLRMVVLPPISLTRESLGNLLPGDAMNLAVGDLFQNWHSISLRPQAAESYALDLDDMLDLIVERDSVGRMVLKQPYRDKLGFAGGSRGDSVWLRVVSEVLYIRAAQISITAKSGADQEEVYAANFGLDSGSSATEASAGGEAKPEEQPLDPAFAAIVRADAINRAIRDNGADVLPDGFVRFLSLSDSFMSMQRVWRRPVAIAARGITLEVDAVTGEVLASGMIGKPLKSHVDTPPAPEED